MGNTANATVALCFESDKRCELDWNIISAVLQATTRSNIDHPVSRPRNGSQRQMQEEKERQKQQEQVERTVASIKEWNSISPCFPGIRSTVSSGVICSSCHRIEYVYIIITGNAV